MIEQLPVIEQLEKKVLEVQSQQSELLMKRRRLDVQDEAGETSVSNEGE